MDLPTKVEEVAEGVWRVAPLRMVVLANCAVLREQLKEVSLRAERAVLVDLDEVDFIDSSGLGVLIGGMRRAEERGIAYGVITANPRHREVLHIAGLDLVLKLYSSTADALAQLQRPFEAGVGKAIGAERAEEGMLEHFQMGLGFCIMKALVDEVRVFSRLNQGTRVRLIKKLEMTPTPEQARMRFDLIIPCLADLVILVRLALSGLASRLDLSVEDIENLKLAVTEACNNAIQHAYPDKSHEQARVVISCWIGEGQLIMEVRDEGRGMVVAQSVEGSEPR